MIHIQKNIFVDNKEDTVECFDLLITALGFESRCTYIAELLAGQYDRGYCLMFKNRHVLAFQKNQSIFESLKFDIDIWDDNINRGKILSLLKKHPETQDEFVKIAVDISSMNRAMVAELFFILANQESSKLEITFFYTPSKYVAPPKKLPSMKISSPVIPEYAGWFDNPNAPLYAVVGLGYEYGKASGIIEYLEVSGEWLFKPIGSDKRYLESLEDVNKKLIDQIEKHRVLNYDLEDPYSSFEKLRSLVDGLLRQGRVVLIPLGPKLFNLFSVIIAEIYSPKVVVWRVSADDTEEPIDHEPDDKFIQFAIKIN